MCASTTVAASCDEGIDVRSVLVSEMMGAGCEFRDSRRLDTRAEEYADRSLRKGLPRRGMRAERNRKDERHFFRLKSAVGSISIKYGRRAINRSPGRGHRTARDAYFPRARPRDGAARRRRRGTGRRRLTSDCHPAPREAEKPLHSAHRGVAAPQQRGEQSTRNSGAARAPTPQQHRVTGPSGRSEHIHASPSDE